MSRFCRLLFNRVTLVAISVALAIFAMPSYASGEKVAVGRTLSPAFQRVFNLILLEANVGIEFLPVPLGRERLMFERGAIQMECCVVPEWRDRESEKSIQHFTIPVYVEQQLLVASRHWPHKIENQKQLSQYTIGVIRGFNEDLYLEFAERQEVNDYDAMFNLVLLGRVDLVIAGRPEFLRQQYLLNNAFKEVYVYQENPLRIRVHESRRNLIPKLNKAILNLQESKVIKAILESYGY